MTTQRCEVSPVSDPTPVPLDEIEQRKAWFDPGDDAMRVLLSPAERDALCEALRIAVEGLEGLRPSIHPTDAVTQRCDAALAAVRELVDLGGDDG